jgi:hypothetical protein
MSHFMVGVILPESITDKEQQQEQQEYILDSLLSYKGLKWDEYHLETIVKASDLTKKTEGYMKALSDNWDGMMKDTDPKSESYRKYQTERYHSKEEYLEIEGYENMPWAILTPEKEWIAAGTVGWFATDDANHDSLVKALSKKKEALGANKGCRIALVDCHI